MEDRRITKTKKNIKETLVKMLHDTPFEKITVADLCRRGELSRITFYTYYDNKYDLIKEMFSDYNAEAWEIYQRLQAKNNPENDIFKGYENLLDCILKVLFNNIKFFLHTSTSENPYLFSECYNYVIGSVDDYLGRHSSISTKYTTKQTATMICSGLFGVVTACVVKRMKEEEIHDLAMSMLKDSLRSGLFGKDARG